MAKRNSGGGLSELPINMLQAELRRREALVGRLHRQHQRLMDRAARVEEQIRSLGASVGGGPARSGGTRSRPRNEMNLVAALEKVLSGATMSVTDAAEAVQRAGYQTTSPNFRTIVNQTLIKNSALFKKVSRGQYTVK